MTHVTIHNDNSISVARKITGYYVKQASDGTKVLAWTNNGYPRPVDHGIEITMPKGRYTLSSEKGREEFKADFLSAYKRPVGAPRQMKDGKRVNVYLDADTIEKAEKIGKSLSEGIRLAVAKY